MRGSGGLRGSHYCPCPSYHYKVVERLDITCKHLLAVRLAVAMQSRANVKTLPVFWYGAIFISLKSGVDTST